MARPLVMYQTDHPVYWSPVYLASKVFIFGNEHIEKNVYFVADFQFLSFQVDNLKATDTIDGRLMTTVSAPVFDRRNHSVNILSTFV